MRDCFDSKAAGERHGTAFGDKKCLLVVERKAVWISLEREALEREITGRLMMTKFNKTSRGKRLGRLVVDGKRGLALAKKGSEAGGRFHTLCAGRRTAGDVGNCPSWLEPTNGKRCQGAMKGVES